MEERERTARRRRRERRRRQVRRRRLTALGLLGAVVLAGIALGAGGGGDEPAGAPAQVAGVSAQMRAPAALKAAPAPVPKRQETRAGLTRSRLGSGNAVTLAFGGDVHFESPIREKLAASPSTLLSAIAPALRGADLAMVNVETAITERGNPASKAYVFRAPATGLDALRAAGVDVVTVANNHGMDFGKVGLADTIRAARTAGLPLVGAGWNDQQAYAPHRVTVKGQQIAVIAATQVLDDHLISAWTAGRGKPGLASAKDEARLERAVRETRASADTVVVYLHWGQELNSCPTEVQRALASRLVAAGADVVVGSHAHVLLGAGRMGGALVAYGLGNFVFYAFREITSRTGVLEVTVTGRRVDGYEWVPAYISGGVPSPLAGQARADAASAWDGLRACTGLKP